MLRLVGVVVVVGVGLLLVRVCAATPRGETAKKALVGERGADETARTSIVSVAATTADGDGRNRRLTIREAADDDTTASTSSSSESCAENTFAGGGWGRVVLLVIAILFTFNGLALVCDEFFQASLEKISEVRVLSSRGSHGSKTQAGAVVCSDATRVLLCCLCTNDIKPK